MRIAIIGTGKVGGALGCRWSEHGHQVTFGSRRADAPEVKQLAARCGPQGRAAAPAEAARSSDIVVLATPWFATEGVVRSLGDLAGKIVVDCTNPLGPNFTLAVSGSDSAAEQVASWVPGARVVKAFNTTGSKNMENPVIGDRRLAMFLCGDDVDAKHVVGSLADELGFEPVDAGPLVRARYLEPLAVVWITLAYSEGLGPDFGFALLRR